MAGKIGYRTILVRAAAAILGGYALAATAGIWLSYTLPRAMQTERADAVLTGEMTGFAVYAAAILWAFAARTARRAALGILVPALLFAALAWITGPAGPPSQAVMP